MNLAPEVFDIAVLAAIPDRRAADPYAELKRRVAAAGLLAPRPGYATALIAANLVAFLGLFAALHVFHPGWFICLVAVGLGFVSGQLGFQLHDAGHRQMFRQRWVNSAVGFMTGNLLLGMSVGWWVDKHNRHHGNPNHVDLDPDIRVGMISYSEEQAEAKQGIFRFIAARQAYLFFVLIFGLGWSMHASSVGYLAGRRTRAATVEMAALAAHALVYIGVVGLLVGPWWAIALIVIQKCVGGAYMALVFAPNHKGMPQLAPGDRLDFLRSQVLTSRNVRAHRVTDFLYGGLNYQIEHHLFPTMPRCNVRRAHRMIREFCQDAGVSYHETSIVQSYREILGFLHEVGAPLRPVPAVAS